MKWLLPHIALVPFLLLKITPITVPLDNGEPKNISQLRDAWLYKQRSFPLRTIPTDAYAHAYRDKQNLISRGSFFDAPDHWTPLGPMPVFAQWDGANSGRGSFIKFDPND